MKTIALIGVGILVWFGCAFHVAGMARNSGWSYHLWLAIGVLTGPLGLLFGYLFVQLTSERRKRIRYGIGGKSDIAEMVRCPGCSQSVPMSFDRCQFCGAPLSHGKRR